MENGKTKMNHTLQNLFSQNKITSRKTLTVDSRTEARKSRINYSEILSEN